MSKKISSRAEEVRRAIAVEAARIMSEQGIGDYGFAKRKAAERLGVADASALPRNTEIEAALAEHQRLFVAESHAHTLSEQRRAALLAMQLLKEFEPRLVGSVLSGTATEYADIDLHVFAERAETVVLKLLDRGIPHELVERRVKMDADRVLNFPAVRFAAGAQSIDATVFPCDGIRQSPYSPVDGKPMKRANASELQALIDTADDKSKD